jgi:hypothetical protein
LLIQLIVSFYCSLFAFVIYAFFLSSSSSSHLPGKGPFGTVHLRDGAVFASVQERFSRVRYVLQVELMAEGVVRVRLDEAQPLNGKQR